MSIHYDPEHREWDTNSLRKAGWKDGRVLRVQMQNFLTFDSCEVFPGPALNIVLGPNGNGKSSITHAICLACGGNPKTVGRARDMATFVKNGKEEAKEGSFVEIDLLRTKRNSTMSTTVTIRRTINANDNCSKWHINKQPSNLAAVKEIMFELAIDVDNLCSFMPQDRVGEFSGNSPKEILEQTLALVADDEGHTLADEQKELADFEKGKLVKEKDLAAKKTAFETMQLQVNGMKGEVLLMEARRSAQDKLQLCEVLYQVHLVKGGQAELTKLQNQVQAATSALTEAERLVEPLQQAERALQVNPKT